MSDNEEIDQQAKFLTEIKEKITTRFYSIDTMRGLAIIFMIGVHFVWTWAEHSQMDIFGGIMFEIIIFLGGLSAPFFIFIVGLSLSVSQSRQRSQGIEEKYIWRYSFIRGLLIFFLGYLINILLWGLNEEVFVFDILSFIGFSLMVTSTLNYCIMRFDSSNKTSTYFKAGLFTFFLIFPIILRTLFGYVWMQPPPATNFYDAILSIFFYGYFPFFLFYFYMLLGNIIGESAMLTTKIDNLDVKKLFIKPIVIVLIVSPLLYLISFSYSFLLIGMSLITFLFLFWFQDLKKRGISNPIQRNIARISRGSLSIFVIQWAFLNWSTAIISYYFGEMWLNNIPFNYILISYVIFMAFLLFFVLFWERKNYKYGLEWLIAKLNVKPTVSISSDVNLIKTA